MCGDSCLIILAIKSSFVSLGVVVGFGVVVVVVVVGLRVVIGAWVVAPLQSMKSGSYSRFSS